jgi:hypothetical protein
LMATSHSTSNKQNKNSQIVFNNTNIMKTLKTTLAIVALTFLSISCNKDDNPAPPLDPAVGTWKLTSAVFTDGPKDVNLDGTSHANVFLEDNNGCMDNQQFILKEDLTMAGGITDYDTFINLANSSLDHQSCYDYGMNSWRKNADGTYEINSSSIGGFVSISLQGNFIIYETQVIVYDQQTLNQVDGYFVKYTYTRQ